MTTWPATAWPRCGPAPDLPAPDLIARRGCASGRSGPAKPAPVITTRDSLPRSVTGIGWSAHRAGGPAMTPAAAKGIRSHLRVSSFPQHYFACHRPSSWIATRGLPRARIHGNGYHGLRNGADGEADTQAIPDAPLWAIARRKWLMRRIW